MHDTEIDFLVGNANPARMKVALIHDALFPVKGYGGTERVVWWLAKGLSEKGVDVTVVCRKGSVCDFASVAVPESFNEKSTDILHLFNTPVSKPDKPHLVTIGGNGKPGETYLQNTVFVSENHAKRHGASAFVHNGVDPDEYLFQEKNKKGLVFLAKASWKVKNVKGAIHIAKKTKKELNILGGGGLFLNHWRGIHWRGMVSGEEKAKYLAEASGLVFPVIWNEPFGIAVIEALVSGTPVLCSPFGSLPELIHEKVGRVCLSEQEFIESVGDLPAFKPQDCRDWALSKFTYRHMAEKYLRYYSSVLEGKSLNPTEPRANLNPETILKIPAHTV